MADDVNLKAGISVDTGSGTQQVKSLAGEVASLGERLRAMASQASSAAKQADSVEKSLAGVNKGTQSTTTGLTSLGRAYQVAGNEASEYARKAANAVRLGVKLPTSGSSDATRNAREAGYLAAVNNEQRNINKAVQEELASRRQVVQAAQAQRSALESSRKSTQNTLTQNQSELDFLKLKQQYAAQQAAGASRLQGIGKGQNLGGIKVDAGASTALNAQNKALGEAQIRAQEAAAAFGTYRDSLANTRYALYDVSNSLGIAGAALVAFSGLTLKAATDYETAFAQIQRTSGTAGEELQALQKDFVNLAQSTPVSFSALTQIGTLAGQLNVDSDKIASFTKTAAQFSATTNVTAEATATAFGRLDALLPGVQGNYDALGSSILQVGVNSVATEQEIITTATQIAAAGTQAGFTADQVIGLAASFASLGVAPEQARGVTTRVFYEISEAVSEGGESLDKFAAVSGQSSAAFADQWKNNASGAFISFLQGLNKAGANAQGTINDLGITAVRDANSLLRLSQNVDQVTYNLGQSAEGFSNSGKLAETFGVQAATLASKVQELLNTIQAFAATVGSGALPVLGTMADFLKSLLVGLTNLASNPFFQGASTFVIGLTAISGAFLLLTSGVVRTIAAFLAGRPAVALYQQGLERIRASMALVQAQAAVTGVSVSRLSALMTVSARAAGGAALALKGLASTTLIGAGFTAAFVAFGALQEQLKSSTDRATDLFGSLTVLTSALSKDQGVNAAKLAQISYADAIKTSTGAIKEQTIAYGENAKQALADALAQSKAYQELFSNKDFDSLKSAGFSREGFTAAILGDPEKGGQEYLDKLQAKLNKGRKGLTVFGGGGPIDTDMLRAQDSALDKLAKVNSAVTGEARGSAAALKAQTTATKAAGGAAKSASGALADESGEMNNLSTAAKTAFATINGLVDVGSSIDTLATGIYNAGNSFSYLNTTGQANLANLQSSIVATIAAGTQMGYSATESVSALFITLQQQGVNTANLLTQLAPSLKGLGVDTDVLAIPGGAGANAQIYANSLSEVADNAVSAAKAQKSNSSATKESAKEMRTAADYASDLSSAFARASDIRDGVQKAKDAIQQQLNDQKKARKEARQALKADRTALKEAQKAYGTAYADAFSDAYSSQLTANLGDAFDKLFARQQGLDAITSQFSGLQKTIADAKNDLASLNAAIDKLNSQKNIATIQLNVAQNYGDDTRATDLQADIAGYNQDLAEKAAAAAVANSKLDRNLSGSGDAAVQNRSDLLSLVDGYQSYISTLQKTGASSDEISKAIDQSKKDFKAQGETLGFSTGQLETFVNVFDQYKQANYAAGIYADTEALKAQKDALQAVKDVQKDIKIQQDLLNTSTKGNSDAALRNRDALRELEGKVADYATALAGAGYSQDQIKAKLDTFKGQIVDQAKEAGLSKDAIKNLKGSISDLDTIINGVPRKLTVSIDANTDPAKAALREFDAKMKEQGDKKYSGGTVDGIKYNDNADSEAVRKGALIARIVKTQDSYKNATNDASNTYYGNLLEKLSKRLKDKDYATGGFTGQGGKYVKAGNVHKGEFVIPSQYVNQNNGLPNAQAMNWIGGMNGASAGGGITQVELSPTDRALLAAAGNVQVTVGGQVIAQATNANNLNSAQRGAN